LYIEHVAIKNFRSIVSEDIRPKDLTVFVGNNDVGKSNFLKALNLFFNGETESGNKFDFKVDFCRFTDKQTHKAQEIDIEITFTPPSAFAEHTKKVLWKKTWRSEGIKRDEITFGDGSDLSERSRLRMWVRRLQFRYVPAIKSGDYFSLLLVDLYRTLYQTIQTDLQGAGSAFIKEISKHTLSLSKELKDLFGFSSVIQLPPDLSNLFSTLDFETSIEGKQISLNQRGDGIKARHIPVILRFLAEKERLHHKKGAVRADTIWGYEEPENNLEMTKSFELASEFVKLSNDIQILLTTHSPAFYSVIANSKRTYYVLLENKSSKTKEDLGERSLNESMGLMPIISPYITEKQTEISNLESIINKLQDDNCPVLFVEGKTDIKILTNAWKKLFRGETPRFRFVDAFGCNSLKNIFTRKEIFEKDPNRVFMGMLDFDDAYDPWIKLKEKEKHWQMFINDEKEGLCLKHDQFKGYVFLLPVPEFRKGLASEKYAKTSALTIELLFKDDQLEGFARREEVLGGGYILRMNSENKNLFADKTANFNKTDFEGIEPIFTLVNKILTSAGYHGK
jgi:AAA15 family ATPase/GTPase